MATDLSLETEIAQSKINLFLEKNAKPIITGILAIGAIILIISLMKESSNQSATKAQELLSQSIIAEDLEGLQTWITNHATQYPQTALNAQLKIADIQWDTDPTASIETLNNLRLLNEYTGEQSAIIIASLCSKLIELGSDEQLKQAQEILEQPIATSYLSSYLQTILGDIYWKQGNQEQAMKIWEETANEFKTIDPTTGAEINQAFGFAAQNRTEWTTFKSPKIQEAPIQIPAPAATPTTEDIKEQATDIIKDVSGPTL